ncbi:protocadherin Fat 1-like [Mya arenaria]|uniref:protocadherin Fat 1-like n=1 Tax=Mya arenaria TaxID=6604 RepID=UPI0022E64DEF|nr:protocadherin Fat 1-like [Mya arenaria]
MEINVIIVLCFVGIASAQITGWTETKSGGGGATITDATGSMTVTSVREDITGTPLFTVTAAATGSPTITYTFSSDGNPDTIADPTITAGVVNIASGKELDYETNKQLVFKIEATDGSNTGTATITLPITNVDDVSPSFGKPVEAVCVANGAVSGTRVITVRATDPDTTALSYSITTGNINSDFVIANNGSVTVANTLNATAIPGYSLQITASDTMNTDAIQLLIIYVGDCGFVRDVPQEDNFTPELDMGYTQIHFQNPLAEEVNPRIIICRILQKSA